MRATTRVVTALSRWVWWSEGHVFAFTPEQIGIVEGIRASVAIGVMLIADLKFHIPDFAFGAIAAFWTCLCDPGGPARTRRRVMMSFAVGATAVIAVAAYIASWGLVAGGIALFTLVLLCGLTRTYRPTFGPTPSPVGLIAAVAVVVGVTTPRSIDGALHLAGCFMTGSLWAVVLCVYLWRTHPRGPARRALASIFSRLEDMTQSLLALDESGQDTTSRLYELNNDHRRAVRLAIERGREIVASLNSGRVLFGQSIDAASRVFNALIALTHHRDGNPQQTPEEHARIEDLCRLLKVTVDQADKLKPDAQRLLIAATLVHDKVQGRAGTVDRATAMATEALVSLARHWQEPEHGEAAPDAPAPHAPFDIAQLPWRPALRAAVAVSITYALGALFDVTFSYWGTIAALVIMQPLGSNTWLRILERAVGSIGGGVLTAILVARLSSPIEMLLFITPLSAAVIALRLVNYGLFVIFLTPMFVLVSDFIHPASGLVYSRVVNEIIGACIGLTCSLLLWPEKERDTLAQTVSDAIAANMTFAITVLRDISDTAGAFDRLRREAGLASSRAEIARQRLLLQGRTQAAHLDRVHDILAAIRMLCGATNVFAITASESDLARSDRYTAMTARMQALFAGDERAQVTEGFAPHESDDLGRSVDNLTRAIRDYAADACGSRG